MKYSNQPINCRISLLDMRCTNQGCDYETRINIFNGERPTEKHPCPQCGFKCLAPNDAFSEQALQRMVDAISEEDREKIEGLVDKLKNPIKEQDQPCIFENFMKNNPDHKGPLYIYCPCNKCTPSYI